MQGEGLSASVLPGFVMLYTSSQARARDRPFAARTTIGARVAPLPTAQASSLYIIFTWYVRQFHIEVTGLDTVW